MVGKVIRDYMEGGAKRLTIPGFGTFMRKDDGEVIFVDLLRKDDGKLGELVEDYGHYSEVDAMALVDRFIFETKTAIERGGSSVIDGFGTMTLGHKGLYQFKYSPKAKPVKETNATQERLFKHKEEHGGNPGGEKTSPPVPAPKPKPSPRLAPKHASRPASRPVRETSRPKARSGHAGFSRMDLIMVIAVVAAAIAIGALMFGLTSGLPFLDK